MSRSLVLRSALVIFVSMLVPGVGVGNMVASMVLLQMAIFGGFLTNSADTPAFLNWLRFLSLFYYPFEALTANEFQGLDFSLSLEGVVRNAGLQGDSLLLALKNDPARIGPNLVCMTVLCVMLSAWACLAMVVRGAKGGVFACLRCGADEGADGAGEARAASGVGASGGGGGGVLLTSVVSTDVHAGEPQAKVGTAMPARRGGGEGDGAPAAQARGLKGAVSET